MPHCDNTFTIQTRVTIPTIEQHQRGRGIAFRGASVLLFLGVLLLPLLAGCFSSHGPFASKNDPLYQKKLQRVLIAYLHQDTTLLLGNEFSSRFVSGLMEQLNRHHIQCKEVRLEKDAVDRDAQIQAAATQ